MKISYIFCFILVFLVAFSCEKKSISNSELVVGYWSGLPSNSYANSRGVNSEKVWIKLSDDSTFFSYLLRDGGYINVKGMWSISGKDLNLYIDSIDGENKKMNNFTLKLSTMGNDALEFRWFDDLKSEFVILNKN